MHLTLTISTETQIWYSQYEPEDSNNVSGKLAIQGPDPIISVVDPSYFPCVHGVLSTSYDLALFAQKLLLLSNVCFDYIFIFILVLFRFKRSFYLKFNFSLNLKTDFADVWWNHITLIKYSNKTKILLILQKLVRFNPHYDYF